MDNKASRRHDSSRPTTLVSLFGTIDWILAASSLALLVCSALMIANGICSTPHKDSVHLAVCVGGRLSIQSWLAIVGVEFSLLGAVVIPRMASVFISKYLTKRLTNEGLKFSTLLNLQSSAPFRSQLQWGMKRVLFLRVAVVILAITGSIMYKFSFKQVNMAGIIAIPPPPQGSYPGQNISPLGFSDGTTDIVARNVRDVLYNEGTANGSSYIQYPPNSSLFPLARTIIFGPSYNASSGSRLLNGSVQSCTPLSYTRHTIIDYFEIAYDSYPLIEDTPYRNGSRFTLNSSGDPGYLIDFTSTSDGLIQAYWAESFLIGAAIPGVGNRYRSMTQADINVCSGYTSWENQYYESFLLEDPKDIGCIQEDFNITAWAAENFRYAQGIVQSFVPDTDYWSDQVFKTVLATISHKLTFASDTFTAFESKSGTTDIPAACHGFTSDEAEEVAVGEIINAGTGMTLMGMALQALALLTAIVALVILFWPGLPLITEWPAQWLGIVNSGDEMVKEVLRGTSVGENAARGGGGGKVFLSTESSEGGCKLKLLRERGVIEKGVPHE